MYCFKVWFICSVCPSPSGWYPKVKCNFISRALPREWKKWETNLELRLEVTWEGTPCLEKMWRTKSWASCSGVIVLCIGIKITYLERRSTTTRMAVKLEDFRSFLMKSIEMEFHGIPDRELLE